MKKTYTLNGWHNAKHVCDRDNINYQIVEANESEITIEIDLSEDAAEEFEEDVLCEQQRQGTESKLPVYSYRTLVNKEKRDRLMGFYGKRGFHTLKQDYEKAHNYYM